MNSILLDAFACKPTDRVPFWYMRQAGRYLPEYNEIRRGRTFIETTEDPAIACEISLQPLKRFGMDGVIMFSDILTPIRAAGIPLRFEEKIGPVLEKTIESEQDLEIFHGFDATRDCNYVSVLLGRLRENLRNESAALLGFAGAPFTLASYLVEGGGTQKFEKTKRFIFGRTDLFLRLCDVLADLTIKYLLMQIEAGAQAVQIFDSWGGILSPSSYAEFSAPFTARIIDTLQKKTTAPVILFVGNSAHLLTEINDQKPDVISLDWRVTRSSVNDRISPDIAIQGNLDPLCLYGAKDRVISETKKVLTSFKGRQGYVFNLGHGIHPATPTENVQAMIDTIRAFP